MCGTGVTSAIMLMRMPSGAYSMAACLVMPSTPNFDAIRAAALVRCLVLRAELAVLLGQPAEAKRWAGAVVALVEAEGPSPRGGSPQPEDFADVAPAEAYVEDGSSLPEGPAAAGATRPAARADN